MQKRGMYELLFKIDPREMAKSLIKSADLFYINEDSY